MAQAAQLALDYQDSQAAAKPLIVDGYPSLRFMGSKQRLLPWIHEVVAPLDFDTVLDAFSGSGCVSYLFKAMGKRVTSNDSLNFAATVATALVENSHHTLSEAEVEELLAYDPRHRHFIENTFSGIFYTPEDLRFLDRVSWNLRSLHPHKQALALSALIRSCVKRQPRGVFTVAGDPDRYKDGRRDLRLSLREHFLEQVNAYNECVFSNGRDHRALCGDVYEVEPDAFDLVYLDPPYVPRSDDNCYMKRYHFLEGLSCYWQGVSILEDSVVKKIEKPYTPFSYRREAIDAFRRLFHHFRHSKLVLSYSSNGFPDLDVLVELMGEVKADVEVFDRDHRYHFGTHDAVKRSRVSEYLIVGT